LTIRYKDKLDIQGVQSPIDIALTAAILSDSQLSMMFAVCDPSNTPNNQVCLILQILCGFSVEEIAAAFLIPVETLKKRLQRARTKLKETNFQIKTLSQHTIASRLDTVLTSLYLLFNEGYYSTTNVKNIRVELCSEATRLVFLLTENPSTNLPKVNALLALICYQSSRLSARTNTQNEAILFEEQDQSLWDQSLIDRGNYHLMQATNKAEELSVYHLEAAIAYWHSSTTPEEQKWPQIIILYDKLITLVDSPIIALNRIFAFAKIYGPQHAILELAKYQSMQNNYYHALLGYLYTTLDPKLARDHYTKAIYLSKSPAEKQTLLRKIHQLNRKT